MKVIVDTRERVSAADSVLKHLQRLGVTIESRALEVGDYWIPIRDCEESEWVVVERKTLTGLITDVKTRRIWEQCRRLSERRSVMIIERFSVKLLEMTQFRPEAFIAVTASISLEWGIPILTFPSPYWTALFIARAAKLLQEAPEVRVRPLKRLEKSEARDLTALALMFLQGLPGCGPSTAAKLLKRFGSVRTIVNLSPEQLQLAEGVGEKRAKLWWEIFNHTVYHNF